MELTVLNEIEWADTSTSDAETSLRFNLGPYSFNLEIYITLYKSYSLMTFEYSMYSLCCPARLLGTRPLDAQSTCIFCYGCKSPVLDFKEFESVTAAESNISGAFSLREHDSWDESLDALHKFFEEHSLTWDNTNEYDAIVTASEKVTVLYSWLSEEFQPIFENMKAAHGMGIFDKRPTREKLGL